MRKLIMIFNVLNMKPNLKNNQFQQFPRFKNVLLKHQGQPFQTIFLIALQRSQINLVKYKVLKHKPSLLDFIYIDNDTLYIFIDNILSIRKKIYLLSIINNFKIINENIKIIFYYNSFFK